MFVMVVILYSVASNTVEFMRYKDMITEEDFDAILKLGVIVRIAEN